MDHAKLLARVGRSTDRADWHLLETGRASPRWLDGWHSVGNGAWEPLSHTDRAVLRDDPHVVLAWGMKLPPDAHHRQPERWMPAKWNETGFSDWVELFFSGQVVFRHPRRVIDGGRCGLPHPTSVRKTQDASGRDIYRFTITEETLQVFRVVAELAGSEDFDRYLSAAEFEVAKSKPRFHRAALS
jgi:hypothetical protein